MITVITANFNGARFLGRCLQSVQDQRGQGTDIEHLVIDGGSTDESQAIMNRYAASIDTLIREPDTGPANAINKGLRRARGELIAWLNADDFYYPGALVRASAAMAVQPSRALGFGRCAIVDESDGEIRQGITRFKELFFPLSSRFTIQTINYISQPAMVFRRSAFHQAGPLREDLKAAWDYDFILRLWRYGGALRIDGPPLTAFRWHSASISGQHYARQFKEEYDVAAADAHRFSPQALLHLGVRYGIVGAYTLMAWRRGWHARRG